MKGFIADQLGDLSIYDLPGLLFAMIMAGLLTALLIRMLPNAASGVDRVQILTAMMLCLGVALVRGSLPLAVVLAGSLLLVRGGGKVFDGTDRVATLIAVVIGVGCGARASLIVAFGALLILLVLWLIRRSTKA